MNSIRSQPRTRRGDIVGVFSLVALLAAGSAVSAADRSPSISEAKRDKSGFLVHKVESPYQAEVTTIRILLPDERKANVRYPVVYVLPVEARDGHHYGDGLLERGFSRPPNLPISHPLFDGTMSVFCSFWCLYGLGHGCELGKSSAIPAPFAQVFLRLHFQLVPAETPLFLAFPAQHPYLTPWTKPLPGCPSAAGNLPNWHPAALACS